eukprot:6190088-Pleurochrysis_carterae.AAC.1
MSSPVSPFHLASSEWRRYGCVEGKGRAKRVCVCARVRPCVRACLCVCVRGREMCLLRETCDEVWSKRVFAAVAAAAVVAVVAVLVVVAVAAALVALVVVAALTAVFVRGNGRRSWGGDNIAGYIGAHGKGYDSDVFNAAQWQGSYILAKAAMMHMTSALLVKVIYDVFIN